MNDILNKNKVATFIKETPTSIYAESIIYSTNKKVIFQSNSRSINIEDVKNSQFKDDNTKYNFLEHMLEQESLVQLEGVLCELLDRVRNTKQKNLDNLLSNY